MKRLLIVLLLLIIIPLYGYNAFLILRVAFPGSGAARGKSQQADVSYANMLVAASMVTFEQKGRDPFTLYTKRPAPPKVQKQNVPVKKKVVTVAPPTISITGMMWNPDNPVVLLKLADGSGAMAKVGQTVGGGILVKKIEKTRIVVVFAGKAFVIEKK